VKYRQKVLTELSEHLVRFGLRKCPVCDSETLAISRLPVIVAIGGFSHHEPSDPRHDPDSNVNFAAKVECDVCGYMLLFNVERFHTGDEPIIYTGPEEPPDPS
jgi:hypothetical protein